MLPQLFFKTKVIFIRPIFVSWLFLAASSANATSEICDQAFDVASQEYSTLEPYDNHRVETYVNEIYSKLIKVGGLKGLCPKIYLLDTDIPAAYALRSRVIVLSRGILVFLNSEDEFAALLAHELGHISQQDYENSRLELSRISSKYEQISKKFDNQKTNNFLDIATVAMMTGKSRQSEINADKYSLELITEAGYRPDQALILLYRLTKIGAFFIDLNQKSNHGVFDELSLFATHPPAQYRIDLLEKSLKKKMNKKAQKIQTRRKPYLDVINGLPIFSGSDGSYIRNGKYINPGMGVVLDLPSNIYPVILPNSLKIYLANEDLSGEINIHFQKGVKLPRDIIEQILPDQHSYPQRISQEKSGLTHYRSGFSTGINDYLFDIFVKQTNELSIALFTISGSIETLSLIELKARDILKRITIRKDVIKSVQKPLTVRLISKSGLPAWQKMAESCITFPCNKYMSDFLNDDIYVETLDDSDFLKVAD
jgi:predicted Zn-dependent protease